MPVELVCAGDGLDMLPAPLGWLWHVLHHGGRSTKSPKEGLVPRGADSSFPTAGFRVISTGDATCRCREG